MSQQAHSQEPIGTLLYRIDTMEKDIAYLKTQLGLYEPTRENELKLQRINDTVGRIENELGKVKDRLETMNTRMVSQEQEAQKRDVEQQKSQDKLQIRVLYGILAGIFTILSGFLLAYFTHILH